MTIPRVAITAALCAPALLSGCKCGGDAPLASDAASPIASSAPSAAASAPARTPRPTHPAPKAEDKEFTTSDGVKIAGSYWAGGPPGAPTVLLAHRLAGTRAEWIPLVERLFPPKAPMNVLAIDLRGHGASVQGKAVPKGKKLAWHELQPKDFAGIVKDVEAAMKAAPPGSPWVFAGSDLGATALTLNAKAAGDALRGIALISPGAALQGIDLYRPFGQVLRLPNLIVASTNDTVSAEPAMALAQMAKGSRLLQVPGAMHGAEYLGREHPLMWDDLADWIEERVGHAAPATASSASPSPSAPPSPSP